MKLYAKDIFRQTNYHILETTLAKSEKTIIHSHDYFEIFLVTSGQICHYVNGGCEIITKNMLRFIRPDDCHQFSRHNCTVARFINIAFPAETLEIVSTTLSRLGMTIPEGTISQLPYDYAYIIEKKIEFLSKNARNTTFNTENIFLGLLLDILLFFNNNNQLTSIPAWLNNTYEQMQRPENYHLGFKRMVEISGKSQEYLTRMFKKHYNITPTKYINRLQINEAVALLKTTDKTVLEIINDCGFNNVSYFYKCFTDETKMSPKQLRIFEKATVAPSPDILP